jgi:hypothetical protein
MKEPFCERTLTMLVKTKRCRYIQAKFGMMREALAKLDRQANERRVSDTPMVN